MFDTNSFDEFFNELLEQGAIELSAMDENGSPLYSFTEKMIELAPGLAERLQDTFHNDMMRLWQLGFLEMDVTQVNPTVKITNLAVDNEQIGTLPQDLRVTLTTIKQAMRIEP